MMQKCIYKNRLGKSGEERAKQFLTAKGLKFLRSNYRFYRAEIDLIFTDEKSKTLIFVEVKTRRSREFGEPEESITFTKQRQIRKAATGFVIENSNYEQYDLRLDVVSIFHDKENVTVNHIENAF